MKRTKAVGSSPLIEKTAGYVICISNQLKRISCIRKGTVKSVPQILCWQATLNRLQLS